MQYQQSGCDMSFTYIARRPIFNRKQNTVGYELLFSEGENNAFPDSSDVPSYSSHKCIDEFINSNINTNYHSSRCFIHFSYKSLIHLVPMSLPKDKIVIEILETCIPTDELLSAIIHLNRNGYLISCDEFVLSNKWTAFKPYIQIVNIDVAHRNIKDTCNFIRKLRSIGSKCILLAKNIENKEQFDQVQDVGCRFFHGEFFTKSQKNKSENMEPEQVSALNLFAEICKNQVNFNTVEKIIEQDITMSFKLLSFVNSLSIRLKQPISSFKQALVYLGEERLKMFVSMIAASYMSNRKPFELYKLSMQRAQFCLQMSKHSHFRDYQTFAFMIGMSSLLDAMLDNTLELILEAIPLSDDIKNSLLQKNGPIGDLIILAEHYEQANWKGIGQQCSKLDIQVSEVYDAMEEAKIWSCEVFQAIQSINV